MAKCYLYLQPMTDEQERILLQGILPKMDLSSLYLATDRHHEQELQAIHKRNIQVIYLRKFRSDCGNPAVCYDGERVYAQATHMLLQYGHRKILFLFSHTLPDLETEQKLADCKRMLATYKIFYQRICMARMRQQPFYMDLLKIHSP